MAHEISVNLMTVTSAHDTLDYVKVLRLYGGTEQKVSQAFRTAIHELVKDVKATPADLKAVERLRAANLAKRYQKRVEDARYRGESAVDMLDSDGKSGKRGRRSRIYGKKVKVNTKR